MDWKLWRFAVVRGGLRSPSTNVFASTHLKYSAEIADWLCRRLEGVTEIWANREVSDTGHFFKSVLDLIPTVHTLRVFSDQPEHFFNEIPNTFQRIELSFQQRWPPIDFLQRLHHLVRLSLFYPLSPDDRKTDPPRSVRAEAFRGDGLRISELNVVC